MDLIFFQGFPNKSELTDGILAPDPLADESPMLRAQHEPTFQAFVNDLASGTVSRRREGVDSLQSEEMAQSQVSFATVENGMAAMTPHFKIAVLD